MKITIGSSFPLMMLTLAFFFAKVTGHIDWSWWLIFIPLWLPAVIGLTIVGFCFCMAGIAALLR